MFGKVGSHFFKKLGLGIGHKYRFPPLGTAQQEGDDKAPGFSAAWRSDAQQIVVVPGHHPVGHIGGIFVRVVRSLFPLSQHHALDLRDAAQLQKLLQLLFRQETGGAVGGVREDVKAPGIADKLVAGEKDVPLFRDKADQQKDDNGEAQPEGREQHKPVAQGIKHPDTAHLFTLGVEGGGGTQADGVEEHPIEVPAQQSKGDVDRKFGFMPLKPGA